MEFPIDPRLPKTIRLTLSNDAALAEGISSTQEAAHYTLDEVIQFARRKRSQTSEFALQQLYGREDY